MAVPECERGRGRGVEGARSWGRISGVLGTASVSKCKCQHQSHLLLPLCPFTSVLDATSEIFFTRDYLHIMIAKENFVLKKLDIFVTWTEGSTKVETV